MRLVPTLTLGMAALLLAGCADAFFTRPAETVSAIDCSEKPGREESFRYWWMGETGPRVNWSGCDKRNAELVRANLVGATLDATDFSGADLHKADLGSIYGRDIRLRNANLADARMRSAYIVGGDLRGANLSGVVLTGVNLDGVELSGATWTDGDTVCAEGSVGECLPES